jgi:hypothetical protein
MKPHFKVIIAAMLLGLIGAPVLASAADGGQVYTWVDKNGVRHYSDQPVSSQATAVKGLAAHPPPHAATVASVTSATASPAHPAAPVGSAASGADKMTPEQRAARCTKLKEQIKRLESARRVQVTNGDKKKYLSGQDLVDFRHMLEKRAQKVCKAN